MIGKRPASEPISALRPTEGASPPGPPMPGLPAPPRPARPLLTLGILVAVSLAVHLWLVRHTVVLARDGVGFIHYAWKLEHYPWRETLVSADQHPGYPLAIAAMSWPVRSLAPQLREPERMALTAQLVSVIASCFLAVGMYFLGRKIFSDRVAFWGAMLFQCLPVSARVTADALSEALFLTVVVVALLLGIRALATGRARWYAFAGGCGGLAYLIRPEGVFALMALVFVQWTMQAVAACRRPWRQTLLCTSTLTLAAALLAGPYMAAIGGFTVKPTGQDVLKLRDDAPDKSANAGAISDGPPLAAMTLGVWWSVDGATNSRSRLAWSFWAMATELIRTSFYVVAPAGLLGIWFFRSRLRSTPATWLLLTLCALHAAALWRVAWRVGYVSERHVLLLLMALSFWAAALLDALPHQVFAWTSRSTPVPWYRAPAFWSTALPLLLIGAAQPKTLQHLHGNEGRHRAAGQWLAEHTQPEDVIVDPFRWAGYYAGRAFRPRRPDLPPNEIPPGSTEYVVLEADRMQHSKEVVTAAARALADQGELVHRVPPGKRARRQNAGAIEIYRVARVKARSADGN